MVYTWTCAKKLNKNNNFFGLNYFNYCFNLCAIYYSDKTVLVFIEIYNASFKDNIQIYTCVLKILNLSIEGIRSVMKGSICDSSSRTGPCI